MKLIIASLIVFSLVILFLFALFPSDISVTRVIAITSPKDSVLKKITDLENWKNWNSLLIFSKVRIKNGGSGEMSESEKLVTGGVSVVIKKVERDTLTTEWQHNNKKYSGVFVMTETGGQTIVEWTLHFHLRWYPWDKLSGMFYDKEIGPLMEKSLVNLQKETER